MLKTGNYSTTSLASTITAVQTTILLTSATSFPTLAAGDYAWGTIVDQASAASGIQPPTQREVVRITGIAGNVATVSRGQDGTTAQAFFIGAVFEIRWNSRAAQDVNPGWLNVGAFGALGNGGNDTNAINDAIIAANAAVSPQIIYFPPGRYGVLSGLTPITKSGTIIRGAGSAVTTLECEDGVVFQFGTGTQVEGGGIEQIGFNYASAPTLNAVCVNFHSAARLFARDLRVTNAGVIFNFGQLVGAAYAAQINVSDVVGSVANIGVAAFQFYRGAGAIFTNVDVYVAVPNTVFPVSHGTAVDRNVFTIAGPWDTLQVSNCLFQQFYRGLDCNLQVAGAIFGLWFSNVVWDSGDDICFNITANAFGGTAGIQFSNCHGNSFRSDVVRFSTSGGGIISVVDFSNCHLFMAGLYGVNINTTDARNVTFTGCAIFAVNGLATGTDAVRTIAGASRFNITGCRINFNSAVTIGVNYQGSYGVNVGADGISYGIVGNQVGGAVASFLVGTNAAGSAERRIADNVANSYVGQQTGGIYVLPASTVLWTNSTPFPVQVMIFGGTVTVIAKNGVTTGATFGTFTFEPNEYFAVTYTVAPTTTFWVLNG